MTQPGKAHPGNPYFAEVAEKLGEAYLRYSFTKGTDQEIAFLLKFFIVACHQGQVMLMFSILVGNGTPNTGRRSCYDRNFVTAH